MPNVAAPYILRASASERLHGLDKSGVLLGRQFDDLAAGLFDHLARLLVLLDRELTLEGDRFGDGSLHRALQVVGPGIE